jgi:glycosyltransferase involved in cell wall biosynthesis
LPPSPLPVRDFGPVGPKDLLRDIYAAADVTVVPSRLEAQGLAVLESLACGTPTVAFDVCAMPEMIVPGRNGWLVPAFDIQGLGATLVAALDQVCADAAIREACRAAILEHNGLEAEARSMQRLFETILAGSLT